MITYKMIRELLHFIADDLRETEWFKWRWLT